MRIILNALNDFVEEVRDSVDQGSTPCVRFLIDVDDAYDSGRLVLFLASYVAEDQLICELELPCGKDINEKYKDGTAAAVMVRDKLENHLKDLGLKLKKGRYEE
tara:strand:+ start:8458 stop:8769 length:312 start_codon:yes stop_codon:yes gene_type:complete